MKKTTIIFDCFGVICTESIKPWMLANIGPWDTIKDYFHDIARRFDLDEIGEEDVAKEFSQKVAKSPQTIQGEIDMHLRVDADLVEYIGELKKRGYKIGLISNGHHSSFERKIFTAHPGLETFFDSIVISSQVGMTKPDPEIYEHALAKLESSANETIFIDDNQKNITGAEAVGISGILYESLGKLQEDLKAFEI